MRVPVLILTLVLLGMAIRFVPFALLFALPWIAATIGVAWRAGWRVLWSENGHAYPSQADQLRAFGRP